MTVNNFRLIITFTDSMLQQPNPSDQQHMLGLLPLLFGFQHHQQRTIPTAMSQVSHHSISSVWSSTPPTTKKACRNVSGMSFSYLLCQEFNISYNEESLQKCLLYVILRSLLSGFQHYRKEKFLHECFRYVILPTSAIRSSTRRNFSVKKSVSLLIHLMSTVQYHQEALRTNVTFEKKMSAFVMQVV